MNLQVFPNPASSSINFQFELSQPSKVTLTVHNSIGQTVVTLVNRPLELGKHLIQWNRNAERLPAGIYYYRLQVKNQVITHAINFQ